MTQSAGETTVNDLVGNAHGNLAEVRKVLAASPGWVNSSAAWNETPIQAAAHMGNRQIVEYLLDCGAPLDIFVAAMLGRQDDLERFIESESEMIHARGVHDMPLLYFAAAGNQPDVAEWLLERGADVNDGRGQNTALHAAVALDHPAMARWLLDRGADVHALDYESKTPLEVAIEQDRTEIAGLLRQRGAAS